MAEAREAVRLDPEGHFPFVVLGEALLASRRLDDATDATKRVRALDPESPRGFELLGRIALRRRRWSEAEGLFREALARDPLDWDSMNNLGVALRSQRRRKEAIEAFEAASKLMPRMRLSQWNLFSTAQQYLGPGLLAIVCLWGIWLAFDVSDINRFASVAVGAASCAGLATLVVLGRRRLRNLSSTVQLFVRVEGRRETFRAIRRVAIVIALTIATLILVILAAAIYYGQLRL